VSANVIRMPPLHLLLAKLAEAGVEVPPGRRLIGRYGDSPALSQHLIELVRSGKKRASSALLWAIGHDGDPMPHVGDIEIVVDHLGEPAR
jgi:uncharacterized protein YhfF